MIAAPDMLLTDRTRRCGNHTDDCDSRRSRQWQVHSGDEYPVPVELAYGGRLYRRQERRHGYVREGAGGWALKNGKRVADSVQFYIQFGSQETREYCIRRATWKFSKKAGAHVIEPSCGACINAGPGVSTRPDQVISAQNRNCPGRSERGQMYLASPLTVAASAVAGYIVEYEPSEERELVHA